MGGLVNEWYSEYVQYSLGYPFSPPASGFFALTGQPCDAQYDKPFDIAVCKVLPRKCWCAKHPLTGFSHGDDYATGFLNTKALRLWCNFWNLTIIEAGWYLIVNKVDMKKIDKTELGQNLMKSRISTPGDT